MSEVRRQYEALVVHGGAGPAGVGPSSDLEARQRAVERGLAAGWSRIGDGALASVVAAVMQLEDEPLLNAGLGACLNTEGEVEMDAGVMEGAGLRAGAVGAVRDVQHPVELALRILEDGRHVLLVGDGASRFAAAHGLTLRDPEFFITPRQRDRLGVATRRAEIQASDTVGAVARDRAGEVAVAVSTGGRVGKLPGRVGDSPLPGAGFYALAGAGAICGTGHGEAFMRLCTAHQAALRLADGGPVDEVVRSAINDMEARFGSSGGVIAVSAAGEVAAYSSGAMPWAFRQVGLGDGHR